MEMEESLSCWGHDLVGEDVDVILDSSSSWSCWCDGSGADEEDDELR